MAQPHILIFMGDIMHLRQEASRVLLMSFAMLIAIVTSEYSKIIMYMALIITVMALEDLLMNQLYRESIANKLFSIGLSTIAYIAIIILSFTETISLDTYLYYMIGVITIFPLILYNWYTFRENINSEDNEE